jgi:hypothetical protein
MGIYYNSNYPNPLYFILFRFKANYFGTLIPYEKSGTYIKALGFISLALNDENTRWEHSVMNSEPDKVYDP